MTPILTNRAQIKKRQHPILRHLPRILSQKVEKYIQIGGYCQRIGRQKDKTVDTKLINLNKQLYLLFKENIFDLIGEKKHCCLVFLSVLFLQLRPTTSLAPVNILKEEDLEITNAPPILENPRRLNDSDWLVRAKFSMHLERPWVCLVAIFKFN